VGPIGGLFEKDAEFAGVFKVDWSLLAQETDGLRAATFCRTRTHPLLFLLFLLFLFFIYLYLVNYLSSFHKELSEFTKKLAQ
jgi:hypothetical protein